MHEPWVGVWQMAENLIGGECYAYFNFMMKLQKEYYGFQWDPMEKWGFWTPYRHLIEIQNVFKEVNVQLVFTILSSFMYFLSQLQ